MIASLSFIRTYKSKFVLTMPNLQTGTIFQAHSTNQQPPSFFQAPFGHDYRVWPQS